jgi:hypothetical protein
MNERDVANIINLLKVVIFSIFSVSFQIWEKSSLLAFVIDYTIIYLKQNVRFRIHESNYRHNLVMYPPSGPNIITHFTSVIYEYSP